MQNNTVETLIAAAVVVVALTFLFFAYTTTHSGSVRGYELQASLSSADGLTAGDDVRLHGIKIGAVTSIEMDSRTYRPVVHLSIRDDIHIPKDSSGWTTSVLLSTPYLTIQPGRSSAMLAAGDFWKAN
jgi:phospholipid/cholesterol/gamma-HCH transport system substrate-binding protein